MIKKVVYYVIWKMLYYIVPYSLSEIPRLDNRRQAIIWTNAGILLIGPLGINFREILIKIITFSLKMRLKVSSAKRRPLCFGLNVISVYLYLPVCSSQVIHTSSSIDPSILPQAQCIKTCKSQWHTKVYIINEHCPKQIVIVQITIQILVI